MQGFIRELKHQVAQPVEYELVVGDGKINLTECLGAAMNLSFTGEKACIICGRKVKKLYQSGYCFPCVTTLAECDLCIVKPHECHFHKGTCRDESFAMTHCMIPHYVYLAFSSGFKVGLTRKGREFTRWIDQGASQAVLLAEVPTRKMAGEMEMAIAEHISDKTDWRKMLKGDAVMPMSLLELREKVIERLDEMYHQYLLQPPFTVHEFFYPTESDLNVKLTSLSFDKMPTVSGVLRGIKGQYLIFDFGVLNIKKHAGYRVELSVS